VRLSRLSTLKIGAEDFVLNLFSLEIETAEHFTKGLQSVPLLNRLEMKNFFIDEDFPTIFSMGLRHTPLLTTLVLEYASIIPDAARHLAEGHSTLH
jgi:hypothetical protein